MTDDAPCCPSCGREPTWERDQWKGGDLTWLGCKSCRVFANGSTAAIALAGWIKLAKAGEEVMKENATVGLSVELTDPTAAASRPADT